MPRLKLFFFSGTFYQVLTAAIPRHGTNWRPCSASSCRCALWKGSRQAVDVFYLNFLQVTAAARQMIAMIAANPGAGSDTSDAATVVGDGFGVAVTTGSGVGVTVTVGSGVGVGVGAGVGVGVGAGVGVGVGVGAGVGVGVGGFGVTVTVGAPWYTLLSVRSAVTLAFGPTANATEYASRYGAIFTTSMNASSGRHAGCSHRVPAITVGRVTGVLDVRMRVHEQDSGACEARSVGCLDPAGYVTDARKYGVCPAGALKALQRQRRCRKDLPEMRSSTRCSTRPSWLTPVSALAAGRTHAGEVAAPVREGVAGRVYDRSIVDVHNGYESVGDQGMCVCGGHVNGHVAGQHALGHRRIFVVYRRLGRLRWHCQRKSGRLQP